MKRITVLGCGLVGSLIAADLAADESIEVTAVDLNPDNLDRLAERARIKGVQADLSNSEQIAKAIGPADAVVGAVPGRLGLAMLRTVIEAGKPIADISFAPEDPLQLDELAKQRGVTAVVDCGVSPGLSNLAIGRASSKLKSVLDAVIYVGGLPAVRHWPYEYRSVFSPTDVIEEYTRPARLIEHGEVVVKEALSEVELIDFPGVGTLEAFNTDGLRTLLKTVPATNMKEKTLRYPGHVDRMRMLRETGFFSDHPIEVDGQTIVPRHVTEKLMFEKWRRPAGEEELTVLRVVVSGEGNDESHQRYVYDLLDRTDPATGDSSMARTTGFPCAIIARMLATGKYREPGVRPLEMFAANNGNYDRLVSELAKRNVRFREEVETF